MHTQNISWLTAHEILLTSIMNRELQTKITKSYHYTPRKDKTWKTVSNGKTVEHLQLLDIAGENVKW